MNLFNQNGYYTRTIKNLCKNDAKIVKKNWENIYNSALKEINAGKKKK